MFYTHACFEPIYARGIPDYWYGAELLTPTCKTSIASCRPAAKVVPMHSLKTRAKPFVYVSIVVNYSVTNTILY